MKLWKRLGLLICAVPMVIASGCTGSDVLSTGNTSFTVSVEITNPETRHEFALFTISAINVRPNPEGGAADLALGSNPIGIIATQDDLLNVDLNDVTVFQPRMLRLSSGSYRVNRIELSGFTFVDFQAPIPAPTCQDLFSYPTLSPVRITAAQLGDPNITVTDGGQASVTIRIDGAALVDAFEAAFTSCSLATGSASPTQFNRNLFAEAAPTFITID